MQQNNQINQHIVNVAFSFDDERITKSIEGQVERQVINNITEEVKEIIYEKRWTGAGYDTKDLKPLKRMIESQVATILDENKDLIIENASSMLCEKMFRSKVVKDAVAKKVTETEVIDYVSAR